MRRATHLVRGTSAPAWRGLLALALSAAVLAGTGAASAEPVGFIATTHGDVRIGRDGAAWAAAAQDDAVEIGDAIRTGPDAGARILLVDDTLLRVGEETEFVIERYHVGDAATRETSVLRQTRGRLRTVVGEAFGASTKLEVHTPTSAVGVKGTDFETADASLPGRERWEACLHEGGIRVSTEFGAAEPGEGFCVYTYPDGPPSDPFPNPRAPLTVPGAQQVADEDFEEPVVVQDPRGVAAEGDTPGLPDPEELPRDERELENDLVELPTPEPEDPGNFDDDSVIP